MVVGAPHPPGNYSSDLLSLSFSAPTQPQLAATSKAESGPGAMLDPFSMYEMSQAAAATMHPSQPSPQQLAPASAFASSVPTAMSSQSFQSVPNAPTLAQNVKVQPQPSHTTPFNAMASGAMSYQVQNAQQQFQPPGGMNQFMMTTQSMQAQPQPSLMNTAFSTGIRHPMPQPIPQQSQNSLNGPPMNNNPMTIPHAHGYHPAQQSLMQGPSVPTNGLQQQPHDSATNQATGVGCYPIIHMSPQNQQGSYSNFPFNQNPNAHGPK